MIHLGTELTVTREEKNHLVFSPVILSKLLEVAPLHVEADSPVEDGIEKSEQVTDGQAWTEGGAVLIWSKH